MRRTRMLSAVVAISCGPQVGVDDDGGGTSGGGTTGTDPSATMTASASASASATDPSGDPTSATVPGTSMGSGPEGEVTTDVPLDEVTTIDGGCLADLGGATIECDPFAEDCPCDEKCMPWANDGGNAWNALMCTPVAADPKQVGEPCTVEGNGVSGIDDCDLHSMCWNVDPETNMGTCVAFCLGSAKEPACVQECARCTIANEGVLALCFPTCDPLASDCPQGQSCLSLFGDGFICTNDLSGDGGAAGEECEFVVSCDPGLACMPAAAVPGCAFESCCTPFCDVTAEDPCASSPPGTFCQPWTLDRVPPCENPNIGVCTDKGG